MSVMYNLRSSQRKTALTTRNCYLHNYVGDKSPEAFNPKVCVKRLKLLDHKNIHNNRFYLEKDRIKVKQEKSKIFNKTKFFKFFCSFILLLLCLIYCRNEIRFYGITIAKKFTEFQPPVQNYYREATIVCKNFLKSLNHLKESIGNYKEKSVIDVSGKKYILESKEDLEIIKLFKNNFLELKNENNIKNLTTKCTFFIEEQCQMKSKNDLKKLFVEDNLTDYALESLGADIVTVFDTEPYGTMVVKFLNFNIWPPLSRFLMSRLKYASANGPNSILTPWKKPGDCWAFKGSRGRVQIKLSEEIFITAITVDHIPKTAVLDENIESAPKKFSIVGVKEPGTLIGGEYLGTYEYKNNGPPSQTFLVQPKVEVPFRWIDLSIESNHGNKNYTCIYKIRVHGHK